MDRGAAAQRTRAGPGGAGTHPRPDGPGHARQLDRGVSPPIPALVLPDPDDRHVLAAAITGRCDLIVTQNLADFPTEALAPFGIDVQHPDAFLVNHLHLAPGLSCASVRKVRARLKNPPYSVEDYLGTLTQIGLVATAAELGGFAELL